MNAEPLVKARPYWHVDAKWIVGLLLFLLLLGCFLLYTLDQITAEKNAVEISAHLLAASFSREGLDEEGEIERLKQELAADPDGEMQPIPGLRVYVRYTDIQDLTPRQARVFFFRQLATPLYQDGPQGLASLADDPEMRQSMLEGVGVMAFFTRETHMRLRRLLTGSAIPAILLLGLLIFFSYRFGRLASPGCVTLAAALPGLLLVSFARLALNNPPESAPGEPEGFAAMADNLIRAVAPLVLDLAFRAYLIFAGVGLALLLVALLGALAYRLVRRKRSSTL